MKDSLVIVGLLAFWIVLNRWVLPMFGVQTCMSGACSRVPQTRPIESSESLKSLYLDDTIADDRDIADDRHGVREIPNRDRNNPVGVRDTPTAK